MDAPPLPLKESPGRAKRFLDLLLKRGLQASIIIGPLLFASVPLWSQSLMESAAFILLGAMLLRRGLGQTKLILPKWHLAVPIGFFILIAAVQIVHFPQGVLSHISPKTLEIHRTFGATLPDTLPISLNPGGSVNELLKLLAYAAVFFVTINYCKNHERIDRLMRVVVYTGIGLIAIAVLQKLTWNGRLYWFYPLSKEVPYYHSIWGPYINRNHFAGYMEMAIPIALGYVIYAFSAITSNTRGSLKEDILKISRSKKLFPAAAYFFAAMIMAVTLFATFSRGAVIGALASLIIFTALAWTRKSLRRALWIAIALIGVIALTVSASLLVDIEHRFMDYHASSSGRLDIWINSLKLIRDYPLFGTGLGTFNDAYMSYQARWSAVFFEHAESDYLEIIAETGLTGILAVAAMIAAFIYTALVAWKRQAGLYAKCMGIGGLSAMSALLIHAIGDFNMRVPANALTFTIIAGATYGLTVTASPDSAAHEPKPTSVFPGSARPLLFALIAMFTLALLYLPATGLLSEYYHARAQRILDDTTTEYLDQKPVSIETLPDYLMSIENLETAIRLSPWRTNYHEDLSLLHAKIADWSAGKKTVGLKGTGTYETAAFHMKKAVDLRPLNPYYHYTLGVVYDRNQPAGNLTDREFDAAVASYPINAPLRYSIIKYYLFINRPEKAMRQARILADIDDTYVIDDPREWAEARLINSEEYRSKLKSSFLYTALDIAWQTSGHDPGALKAVVPPLKTHPQAEDVYQMFLEANDLEE